MNAFSRIGSLCLLLLCTCLSLACRQKVGILGELQSNYHKILKQHSIERKFYALESVPFLTNVVYRSPSVRQAYVNEYAKKYRLTEQERNEMLENEMKQAREYEEFVVFHFASNQRSPGKVSLSNWRLRLVTDATPPGERQEPEYLGNLPGETGELQYFYPQMSPWSKNYIIRFKKAGPSSNITLTMDSVDANLEFNWQ